MRKVPSENRKRHAQRGPMANIFDLFKQIETQRNDAGALPVSALIVGLGNPGKEYLHTRHNMGFLCMDILCDALHTKTDRSKFHALCGEARIAGRRVLLLRPLTYMNHSGESVAEAAAFYKIAPEQIYVISDDVSLAPGSMRIRKSGSAGGHNGLKSIIESLGSDAFPRIRIGVGQKPEGWDLADWVLGTVPVSEREGIGKCFDRVLPALELMLEGDTEKAMCLYNGKADA